MKIFYTLFMVVSILSSQTINEQIQALEEATPTERVALMNHIKEQLIEMNQNERTETIHLLKAQFHNESRVDEHGHEVLSSEHLSQEQEIHEHQLGSPPSSVTIQTPTNSNPSIKFKPKPPITKHFFERNHLQIPIFKQKEPIFHTSSSSVIC